MICWVPLAVVYLGLVAWGAFFSHMLISEIRKRRRGEK